MPVSSVWLESTTDFVPMLSGWPQMLTFDGRWATMPGPYWKRPLMLAGPFRKYSHTRTSTAVAPRMIRSNLFINGKSVLPYLLPIISVFLITMSQKKHLPRYS